jgi:hypothetical protein
MAQIEAHSTTLEELRRQRSGIEADEVVLSTALRIASIER